MVNSSAIAVVPVPPLGSDVTAFGYAVPGSASLDGTETAARPSNAQAARFLAQAGLSSTPAEIQEVVAKGYAGWLNDQLAMPRASTYWDWLVAQGYSAPVNYSREAGFDAMLWESLITGKDQLRQRISLALMNMLVVGIEGTPGTWQQFSMAAYMDILWNNAFGNYRTILEQVSTSPVMGWYLTFINSQKASPGGSIPDENYAREIMQLFSLGLHNLNIDGTQRGGETYTLADVTGLARVFTGWIADKRTLVKGFEHLRLPMIQDPNNHENGAKTFLGTTIPARTNGAKSLKMALDTIFAHPNVAPFVSRHLIQTLVTSNPSPAYIQRVARVFENNGAGVSGDLKAVALAILLDVDARANPAGLSFGKLREPVLRFVSWARAFGAKSPSSLWKIDNTDRLVQKIGRSPSVFNFFRPGYTPPNTLIAAQRLVAPEFQITSEPTVITYINFMIVIMRDGSNDFKANYAELLTIQGNTTALLARLNLTLAADQVTAGTLARIGVAVDDLKDPLHRIITATTMLMASPEYLILK